MIAPKDIPEKYKAWNRKHGSPYGYVREKRNLIKRFYSEEKWLRMKGPFGVQLGNNRSREFEYPWAYDVAELNGCKRIVELGGSLSGFQFILAKEGHAVINVDPGLEASGLGWPVDDASIQKLNQWFGTKVDLRRATLENAGIEDESVDIIFSISVLEHLTMDEYRSVFIEANRILKPRGQFVITLDLFLNLTPFCSRLKNEFGTNKRVDEMLALSGLRLLKGKREELYGFKEFEADKIQSNLEEYFIGSYPVLTQCIVLQKEV